MQLSAITLSAITLAAITLAAIAASQASATNLKCNITDNRNNTLVYDFVEAIDELGNEVRDTIAERSYTKNGVTTANNSIKAPYWTFVIDQAAKTISLWARVDKGWAITFFTKDSPNVGNASLFAPSGRIVGSGVCAIVPPASAPPPPRLSRPPRRRLARPPALCPPTSACNLQARR